MSTAFIKMSKNEWDHVFNLDDETKDVLMQNGFLVESHTDELNDYKYDFYSSIFDNSGLTLYITPTMLCNFCCFYCFEDGQKKQGIMTKLIEDRIVDFIARNSQNPVYIIWFGGEPLIGFNVMQSISKRLIEKGINFSSSLITNGSLLTMDKIAKLENLHLSLIQISMDGAKHDQDARRYFKDGRPSFDIIINNIRCLLENTDIPLTIQVTVDKTNANGYDDLVQYCKEEFPTYYNSKRLQIGFNHVQNRTGFDVDNKCFSSDDLSYLKSRRISKCNDSSKKCDFLPQKALACGYRSINTLSIDAEGYVYPCLEYLGDPSKAIGSLKDNKLSISKIKQCAFKYNPFDDEECIHCSVLPLCGGGCPRDYEKANCKEIRCTYLKDHLVDLLPLMDS